MAGTIEMEISPKSLVLSQGEKAEVTVALRNKGQTVDQLTLGVAGFDPDWYRLPVSSVALFPMDKDNLKIIIILPETMPEKRDAYTLQVTATSQEHPEESVSQDLAIQVREAPRVELSISPSNVKGRKGTYRIVINNPAASEARLSLEASGPGRDLRFVPAVTSLNVPGGGHAEMDLGVRLGWSAILLGREKTYDFRVAVMTPEQRSPDEASILNAQLTGTSWYRPIVSASWYRSLRSASWYRSVSRSVTGLRIPFLSKPPTIVDFKAVTRDKREFRLSWETKKSRQVQLDGEKVGARSERVVRPLGTTQYSISASNQWGTATKTITVEPLPIPTARTLDRIRATISAASVQIQAGGAPSQIRLDVQNIGDIVDRFAVVVEGLDDTWYTRSVSELKLMSKGHPEDKGQVQITFQPPKRRGVRSGQYPFGITLRSQSEAKDTLTIVGQLEILPSIEYTMEVRPYRVSDKKKGKFRLGLTNTGVTDTALALEATDLEEACNFEFKNPSPKVAAWETVEVPMQVKPKKKVKAGGSKLHMITVSARSSEGVLQTTKCEFNQLSSAQSARLVMRLVRIAIVVAVIGVIAYFVIKFGGGWDVLTRSPNTWAGNIADKMRLWFYQ